MISIIIPAFKEEKNIARLLTSIKNQSYKSYEIIVVDDNSPDRTAEISKQFTKKVYTRPHAERSTQRNFGARISKGENLLFLDADMELTDHVLSDCATAINQNNVAALVIPEKTVGETLIANVRKFERKMYLGDPSIEVARFFKKEIFFKFGGYDKKLTGTEDYDLPYRISKKYKIGRASKFILHHEEGLTLGRLLRKRFYYAKFGALYAKKHPELIKNQGILIFRMAYLRNWRNFLRQPVLGLLFIVVKGLESVWAVSGFISAVGLREFLKTAAGMLTH